MSIELVKCKKCDDIGISEEIHGNNVCDYANMDIKEEHLTEEGIPYYCKYSKEI